MWIIQDGKGSDPIRCILYFSCIHFIQWIIHDRLSVKELILTKWFWPTSSRCGPACLRSLSTKTKHCYGYLSKYLSDIHYEQGPKVCIISAIELPSCKAPKPYLLLMITYVQNCVKFYINFKYTISFPWQGKIKIHDMLVQ